MRIKTVITSLLLLFLTTIAGAQIEVSNNNRFLQTKDGKPFFWLGDTDWELFHRMTRDEAVEFINIRSEQGFNPDFAVGINTT